MAGPAENQTSPTVPAPQELVLLDHADALEHLAGRQSREASALGIVELTHDLVKEIQVFRELVQGLLVEHDHTDRASAVLRQLDVLQNTVQDAAWPAGRAPVDMRVIATEVAASAQLVHSTAIDVEATGDCTVDGYCVPLRRAVLNLVDNAMTAAGGGSVQVLVRSTETAVVLSVQNDGAGFSANGPGPGLGLTIVRDVTAQHGGSVSLSRGGTEGARVELHLPRG